MKYCGLIFCKGGKVYYYRVNDGLAKTIQLNKPYNIVVDNDYNYGNAIVEFVTILDHCPLSADVISLRKITKIIPLFKCSLSETKELDIKKVIFSNAKTIVIWQDGTKTMVSKCEQDADDKEKAIALCFMKKIYGNSSKFKKVFDEFIV